MTGIEGSHSFADLLSAGSHLCHFYDTSDELIEVLVPYFWAGVERGEKCLWITTPPLSAGEARAALAEAAPALADAGTDGWVEILESAACYGDGSEPDQDTVVRRWTEWERDALSDGFRGLRIGGSAHSGRGACGGVEIEALLRQGRISALCSYPFAGCAPRDVLRAFRGHGAAVTGNGEGTWSLLPTAELDRLHSELSRLRRRAEEWEAVLRGLGSGKDDPLNLASNVCQVLIGCEHECCTELGNRFAKQVHRMARGVERILGGDSHRSAGNGDGTSDVEEGGRRIGPEVIEIPSSVPASIPAGGNGDDPDTRGDAHRDPVTGLVRRDVLEHQVRKSFGRVRRSREHLFAVIALDLDGFHTINRQHGRAAGDEVLAEVGHRIRACLREMDTAGRIAADQFGIHLDDLQNESDPLRVASRIQHALAWPVEIDGGRIHVSACAGIALASTDAGDADQLLWAAQKALNRAQARGRGEVQVFDPGVRARTTVRTEVEARIRRGLENDELSLHYQPIVDFSTGRVEALEALLRWDRTDGDLELPPDVIPVAEETGLIVPLGWWTLETACRQAGAWRTRASDAARVSVNVSALQLAQPEVAQLVARTLERTGVPGDALQLEITETAVMRDPEAAAEALERIRALGVRIQLDDFGTGYSCLAHLCRLPVDTVKIDRAFVGGMADRPESLHVVRTIMRMAREMGLSVVAEGVETEAQEARLRELGCESVQGYLYHRPMSAEAVEELLRNGGR